MSKFSHAVGITLTSSGLLAVPVDQTNRTLCSIVLIIESIFPFNTYSPVESS